MRCSVHDAPHRYTSLPPRSVRPLQKLKLAGIDVTAYDLNDNRFLVTLQASDPPNPTHALPPPSLPTCVAARATAGRVARVRGARHAGG
jgi:hypothetical protein